MPSNTALGFPYPLGTDRVMDGDNVIQSLAQKINDAAGVAYAGSVSIPVPAINTNYSAAVTFPVGLFTANPVAVVNVLTSSPHVCFTSITNVTATGATVYMNRSSGTGTQVIHFLVVQVI